METISLLFIKRRNVEICNFSIFVVYKFHKKITKHSFTQNKTDTFSTINQLELPVCVKESHDPISREQNTAGDIMLSPLTV